jgi:hypothetical protein
MKSGIACVAATLVLFSASQVSAESLNSLGARSFKSVLGSQGISIPDRPSRTPNTGIVGAGVAGASGNAIVRRAAPNLRGAAAFGAKKAATAVVGRFIGAGGLFKVEKAY